MIAIHGPTIDLVAGPYSVSVRIDGREVGEVWQGSVAEFAVEPGEHTVAVGLRSRPRQVVVGPASRTDLAIISRSGMTTRVFLPALLALTAAGLLIDVLRPTAAVDEADVWLRLLLGLAVFTALFGGYVLVTVKVQGYWATWTLAPATTSSSETSAGG